MVVELLHLLLILLGDIDYLLFFLLFLVNKLGPAGLPCLAFIFILYGNGTDIVRET